MQTVAILLFEEFETLDAFGPAEIFGRLKELYQVRFYSMKGGIVKNSHGVAILTEELSDIALGTDIFLLPGGWGTRPLVNDLAFIALIKQVATASQYVLTVCTGSGLLAKTGLLAGKNVTSNKRAFEWASQQDKTAIWYKKARWTVDGNYYTSGGVSAGMDMTLGFLQDLHGIELAREVASQIEYTWQENKEEDAFGENL
jgi:putative intracellular protease/amidase